MAEDTRQGIRRRAGRFSDGRLAESARLAGKGEERVEAAVVTADACKTAFEGAAVEEFVDDLRDGGPQRPMARLIGVRVTGEEGGKVVVGALPEGA